MLKFEAQKILLSDYILHISAVIYRKLKIANFQLSMGPNAAMGFAELGTLDGVVFAGVAGGRGGGAGCHNGDCARPGWVKKAGVLTDFFGR